MEEKTIVFIIKRDYNYFTLINNLKNRLYSKNKYFKLFYSKRMFNMPIILIKSFADGSETIINLCILIYLKMFSFLILKFRYIR